LTACGAGTTCVRQRRRSLRTADRPPFEMQSSAKNWDGPTIISAVVSRRFSPPLREGWRAGGGARRPKLARGRNQQARAPAARGTRPTSCPPPIGVPTSRRASWRRRRGCLPRAPAQRRPGCTPPSAGGGHLQGAPSARRPGGAADGGRAGRAAGGRELRGQGSRSAGAAAGAPLPSLGRPPAGRACSPGHLDVRLGRLNAIRRLPFEHRAQAALQRCARPQARLGKPLRAGSWRVGSGPAAHAPRASSCHNGILTPKGQRPPLVCDSRNLPLPHGPLTRVSRTVRPARWVSPWST
jgi:hypothetical protein